VGEATFVVFSWPTRRLHDTVEGHESLNDQLCHLMCPFDRIQGMSKAHCSVRPFSGVKLIAQCV
jgi:hypothetical protein